MSDLRFALRQLLKNPGFTAVAVLTLALGIGANTAVFSFVNAILLRPLPYREPDRLMMVFENARTSGISKASIGAPVLGEWRRQATLFEGLGAIRNRGNFTLSGVGLPESLKGSAISANLFSLLGVRPLLGRDFLPEEETFGKHRVLLLSHELWQRRFGGDPGLVGRSLTLNGEPHLVVGVMPPRTFSPNGERELWTPLAFTPDELASRHSHNFRVYGRLKPEATLAQASAEMDLIAQRMGEADAQNRGWGAEVYPLHEIIVGDSRRLLLLLLGAAGLVLLIGCANIGSLLLARSQGRRREFAIRASLGAERGALIRQLLTESLLLAAIGGGLGILLARLGLSALLRASPPDLPRMTEGIPLDAATLGFTALVTLVTGILFGLVPARQASNPSLAGELAESTRGNSSGRRRQFGHAALIVSQVALSLMLLVGAGLMIRSFANLLRQNLGFVPEQLVTMQITLPEQKYPEQPDRVRVFGPLLTAVRAIPGVESAGYAYGAPLTQNNGQIGVTVPDAPPAAPGGSAAPGYAQVSPGYFATMKTPLLQGRDFSDQDDTRSLPVAIVDETFVKNFQLGTNVIGRRLKIGDGTDSAEIVGVVRDVRREGLETTLRGQVYRPYLQNCWGIVTLVVRSPRDPMDLLRTIRAELDASDKDQPLANVRTMTQLVDASAAQRRLSTQLLGAFASSALTLAALGLYGVLAYQVSQRTSEIGIRMALGARPGDVLSLVLRQGMILTGLGLALGLAGSLALSQMIARLLYEVKPLDPLTFIGVSLLLLGTALFACWLPARRASRVDPMVALRNE